MTEWMPIDLETDKLSEIKKIRGVDVKLLVSPYDVPRGIRWEFDKEKRIFLVEFRYIGSDEPLKESRQDKYTVFHVGETTKRIFKIVFDVDGLSGEEVSKDLLDVFKKLIQEDYLDNYRLARSAVSQKIKQIGAAAAL